jgi:hypothetical protein
MYKTAFVRLDCHYLTVDSTPVRAQIETVADDRLEVVLHEPLFDQMILRERSPNLFRWMGQVPLNDNGTNCGGGFGH